MVGLCRFVAHIFEPMLLPNGREVGTIFLTLMTTDTGAAAAGGTPPTAVAGASGSPLPAGDPGACVRTKMKL